MLGPEGIMRLLYCATAGWLETLSGEFAAAHGLLDEGRALGAELRDPRWATWLLVVCAQLELLEDHPEGARREVAEGLLGEPRYQELTFAARIGLEAEADLAELGRARRRDVEVAEARTRADALLARSRAVVATFPDASSPTVRWLEADLTTAEAELTRLEGRSDAIAWTAVAARWEALRQPYEGRLRPLPSGRGAAGGRASAPGGGSRAPGGVRCRETLGARPLQARIEALARRGRVEIEPAEEGTASAEPGVAPGPWRPVVGRRCVVGGVSTGAGPATPSGSRPVSARSWRSLRRAARTARSATPCSSARAPPASTSRTSWASSA